MKSNTIPEIMKVVDEATVPVVILLVSGGCDGFKLRVQDDVEKAFLDNGKPVSLFTICLPEESLAFPRPETPILYYFLPQNHTPIFWRSINLLRNIAPDMEVAHKMLEGMTEDEARYTPEIIENVKNMKRIMNREKGAKFPPLLQQGRNFAKELWLNAKQSLSPLPVITTTEEGRKRLDTCSGCEKFDAPTNRCMECGCNMLLKSQLVVSQCPLGKW